MDQIKLLVKDVLHKIQDIPEVPFTPVRMSEITSQSSLSTPTSRSTSEKSMSEDKTDLTNTEHQNNNVTPIIMSEIAAPSPPPIHISTSTSERSLLDRTDLTITDNQNNNGNVELGMQKGDKLVNGNTENLTNTFPEVTKIKNASSISINLDLLYINDKDSHDSVFAVQNRPPVILKAEKQTQPRIIMGKRALLRSRSSEMQDDPAVVVHELVNEKYHDKLSHYIGRMYNRRLSRESKSTDDDGTSSNYSTNSLRTPDSLYDGKSYFSLFFPPKSEAECDFFSSIDNLNKNTRAEVFNSTAHSANGKNIPVELEYDSKVFLKDAFGDVSFDTQSADISLHSSRLHHSKSLDPVNRSTLLSKAGSVYSSVRKSLRRACSFREKNPEEAAAKNKNRNRDRCQSFSPDCYGSAENLVRELYVQNGIIFQVSKALTFCRNSKDIRSPEYVEAEKILLVASCQKEAIQSALDAIEFGDKQGCCHTISGTLDLSKLVYYLKGDVSTEQETPKNFDEYFVIVVTSGKTVLSSKVLVSDKNGEIKSDKQFRLTELQTDFEVSVAIYSMKVKHVEKNHGSDSKHHKKDRKTPCPSTKGFFHLNHHKSSRKNLLVDNISSIKPSSFTLWGSCTIRCSDLEKTHFRMHHVPLSSSLEGYFTAALNGAVKLTNRTSGFLTVGFEDKAHLIWNRRWCVLDGPLLKYWNYPSEEFSSDPIGVIDLARATEKSSPADRSICPRPKSLCLLIRNKEDLVLKYFLSTDSLEEKQTWQDEINFVVGTLISWNCLCPKEEISSM